MRWLFSDIDGTILGRNNEISSRDIMAVKLWIQKEKFSVVSGRMLPAVFGLIDKLNLTDPIITNDGAVIYYPKSGEEIFLSGIRRKDLEQFLTVLEDEKLFRNIILYGKENIYVHQLHTQYSYLLGVCMKKIVDFRKLNLDDIVSAIFITEEMMSKYKFMEIQRKIKLKMYYNNGKIISAVESNTSKGLAIKFLRNSYDKEVEIISIGNDVNDLAMFSESTSSFAVDNAHPCVKRHADGVVNDCFCSPLYDLITNKLGYKIFKDI